jgi:septum formation protein
MLTLILASQSPRRRDLLENSGFQFETHTMEISEIINENLSLDDALMALARQKAEAVVSSDKLLKCRDFLVLSADTVVVLDGEVIGKPKDIEDAQLKLRRLSGRGHIVKTAVCMMELTDARSEPIQVDSAVATSEVFFKNLSLDEIKNYVTTYKPLDKAGAYGVQEMPKGYILRVEGSLDNVMGLPVKLVEELLEKNGWVVPRRKL